MDTDLTIATEIANKNDVFRRGCSYTITRGIQAMPNVLEIIDSVRLFNNFTEENDPYGEHDFGSFEILANTILWKIDYYNQDLSGWCDPLSPDCNRVLTIMLAEEY
jgi:hypothetical protein